MITQNDKPLVKMSQVVIAQPRSRASLEEFRRVLDDFAKGSEGCLAAYQDTYSREDIYFDHD